MLAQRGLQTKFHLRSLVPLNDLVPHSSRNIYIQIEDSGLLQVVLNKSFAVINVLSMSGERRLPIFKECPLPLPAAGCSDPNKFCEWVELMLFPCLVTRLKVSKILKRKQILLKCSYQTF